MKVGEARQTEERRIHCCEFGCGNVSSREPDEFERGPGPSLDSVKEGETIVAR